MTTIVKTHVKRHWLKAWATMTSVALVVVVVLSLVPVGVSFDLGGMLSIGVRQVEAADWLSGYSYRKELPITAATGAGTNYQVRWDVYAGNGTDAAGVVYLGEKCEDFPNDIRFTGSDKETLLDHWYETNIGSDSTYRRYWIEVKEDLGSNRDIYIYYGKSGASSGSSGADTFIQYKGAASATFNESNIALGTQIRYKARVRATADTHNLLWGVADGTTSINNGVYFQSASSTDLRYFKTMMTTLMTTESVAPKFVTDQWYILEFKYKTTAASGYVDGSQIGTAITTNLPTANMGLWMWPAVGTCAQDWSFVAKYVDPEPAVGTAGSEQSYTVEISNTPSSYAFGTLEVGSTATTGLTHFTITNTGSVTVDITIQGTDATGGDDTWTLNDSGTPGENIYALKAGLDGGDYTIIVKKSATYNTLKSGLAAAATQKWGLKLWMPTSLSGYDNNQMSATLTLVASASS